jgi:hypothetical protein
LYSLFAYCFYCLHPLDEWSVRRRNLYLTTHNTHRREKSMPPAGFELPSPSKRAAANPRFRPGGHWCQYLHTTDFSGGVT